MKKANAQVIWYTIVLCLLAIGAMPFAYTQVNYMATPILMALASAHIIWIQRSQLKVRAQIIPVFVFLVLGFVSITVNQTMAYLPLVTRRHSSRSRRPRWLCLHSSMYFHSQCSSSSTSPT